MNNNPLDEVNKLLEQIALFTEVLVRTTVKAAPLTKFVNPHSILCWAVFDGIALQHGRNAVATAGREYLALTSVPKQVVEEELVRWYRSTAQGKVSNNIN